MKVTGITLLSIEEYKKYRYKIKPINKLWWLRSPGFNSYIAACVYSDGDVFENGDYVHNSSVFVRPALVGEGFEDTFIFGDKNWTALSDTLALADEPFCQMAFRNDWNAKNANVYERSDIKPCLVEWFKHWAENLEINEGRGSMTKEKARLFGMLLYNVFMAANFLMLRFVPSPVMVLWLFGWTIAGQIIACIALYRRLRLEGGRNDKW